MNDKKVVQKGKKIVKRVNKSLFWRNVILAICAVVVFVFIVTVLLNLITRHGKYHNVPQLTELSLKDAKKIARKASLRVEVSDSLHVPGYEGGIVLDQSPAPETEVKSGRRIFLTVSSYKQKKVQVPYVTGFSLRQAKNNLDIAGLEIEKIEFKPDMANNYVLEQRCDGKVIKEGVKMEVEQGTGVTLVVGMSSDATYRTVPKLIGFPLKEAKSRLWEAGLNVGKVDMEKDITPMNQSDARVYIQVPEQRSRLEPGAKVTLKLTLDISKIDAGSSKSDRAAKSIATTNIIEDQLRQTAEDETMEGDAKVELTQ